MQKITVQELLEKYTLYDFHDGRIDNMEYDFNDNYLKLKIVHNRATDDMEDDLFIESTLKFIDVYNVFLEDFTETRPVKYFFKNSEIASFDELEKNSYQIIGAVWPSWRFAFSSKEAEVEYEERVLEEE